MNSYKLIIEEEKFAEDFVFTLKILSLNSAQKDLSDTVLLLPEPSPKLKYLLEQEKLNPIIINIAKKLSLNKKIRYLFILADEKNRIKKMSANPFSPGLTLIYTAHFPCPNQIKKLQYFNAAAAESKSYALT